MKMHTEVLPPGCAVHDHALVTFDIRPEILRFLEAHGLGEATIREKAEALGMPYSTLAKVLDENTKTNTLRIETVDKILAAIGGDIRRALPFWTPTAEDMPPLPRDINMPILGTISGTQLIIDIPAMQQQAETLHVAESEHGYEESQLASPTQPFEASEAWKAGKGAPFLLRVMPSSQLSRWGLANGGLLMFRAMGAKSLPAGPHRLCLMKDGKAGLRLAAIGCTKRDGSTTYSELELEHAPEQLSVVPIPAKQALPAYLSVGAMIQT